jgi:hypothetical protein
VFPRAELVNDLRENLLTRSAFAGNEDAQIGWRYLYGHFKSPMQTVAIADYSKTLLYTL